MKNLLTTARYGLIILTLFSLSGCAAQKAATTSQPEPAAQAAVGAPLERERIEVSNLSPAPIMPEELSPGLDAVYYTNYFLRDVTGIPKGRHPEYPRFKKGPILELNHQFGRENVFESGTNRGVGIRMTGYLYFDREGTYELQAVSNDGILLYLDDQLVLSDPEQHSDRESNVGIVTIDQPGWYATTIEYFQRKGTATLKLLWQKPGESMKQPLPRSVYGHKPGLD